MLQSYPTSGYIKPANDARVSDLGIWCMECKQKRSWNCNLVYNCLFYYINYYMVFCCEISESQAHSEKVNNMLWGTSGKNSSQQTAPDEQSVLIC